MADYTAGGELFSKGYHDIVNRSIGSIVIPAPCIIEDLSARDDAIPVGLKKPKDDQFLA